MNNLISRSQAVETIKLYNEMAGDKLISNRSHLIALEKQGIIPGGTPFANNLYLYTFGELLRLFKALKDRQGDSKKNKRIVYSKKDLSKTEINTDILREAVNMVKRSTKNE